MAEEKSGHELAPIIIKKKKHGGHGGHHGGAWKVAFADFMTAMMAFFLVMWLVGQKPEVKEAVQGFFRDPGKYQQQGKSGVLKGAAGLISQKEAEKSPVASPQKNEGVASEDEKKQLELAAQRLMRELEQQDIFQRLRENISVQVTPEGLRIILNESENAPAFFEPGSAKLLQQSAIILVKIAEELGMLSNRIVLEGHTSESNSSDPAYTNWELSADRANAARSLMEVSGLYAGQIREVRGFASSYPMIADRPGDSRNRRVSILVLFESTEKRYNDMQYSVAVPEPEPAEESHSTE